MDERMDACAMPKLVSLSKMVTVRNGVAERKENRKEDQSERKRDIDKLIYFSTVFKYNFEVFVLYLTIYKVQYVYFYFATSRIQILYFYSTAFV